jgi:hypothetical protein
MYGGVISQHWGKLTTAFVSLMARTNIISVIAWFQEHVSYLSVAALYRRSSAS